MSVSLSIIVPCYNEEQNLNKLWERLNKLKKIFKATYDVEIYPIFVDDGSSDETHNIIKGFSQRDEHTSFISFSKNFGKEAAIYAGLEAAITGDYITIIDADLQDPPELLLDMYKMITSEPYDCIATRRTDRKGEPIIRSWFARRFYKIINKFSNVEIVDGARDFRLMTKQMTESVLQVSERNRFSKGIFSWVGYKTKWIEYENLQRNDGSSKWSFFKLTSYAIDGIVAFSTFPLTVAAIIGLFFCFLAFAFIFIIIARTLIFGDPVAGWPSTICILLLVSGVQMFCIGVLGIYISKIYSETKARPIYIAKDKVIKNKIDGGTHE